MEYTSYYELADPPLNKGGGYSSTGGTVYPDFALLYLLSKVRTTNFSTPLKQGGYSLKGKARQVLLRSKTMIFMIFMIFTQV